jgi:ArsR family transcriptional regulator
MNLSAIRVHAISRALSDPRRFEIARHIAAQPSTACTDLRASFPITAATLSHHLKELESCGLIKVTRCGKFMNVEFQKPVWQAYLAELGSFSESAFTRRSSIR